MLILVAFVLILEGVSADDVNKTENVNLSAENLTKNDTGFKYTDEEGNTTDSFGYGNSTQGFSGSGSINSGFSGSTTEGNANNINPSAVMSFSDKNSVSGYIKNFMKSFHYESGVDV